MEAARNWPFAAFTEESKRLFPSRPRVRQAQKFRKEKLLRLLIYSTRASISIVLCKFSLILFFLSSIFICCKVHILFPTHHSLALVGKEIYLFFVVARFANVEARKSFVARAADASPFFGGRPPDSRILYSLWLLVFVRERTSAFDTFFECVCYSFS